MVKNNDYRVTLKDLSSNHQKYIETIFATGNGHIGVRASHLLKVNHLYDGEPGTFVNGFFEQEPIQYGEWAYGYAKNHQTICTLPNIRGFIFKIGEEASNEAEWQCECEGIELALDEGILYESYNITTPSGKQFTVDSKSFTSFSKVDIYAQQLSIRDKNFTESIEIRRVVEQMNMHKENDDPRVADKQPKLMINSVSKDCYSIQTERSQLTIEMLLQQSASYFDHQTQQIIFFAQIGAINQTKLQKVICSQATWQQLLEKQLEEMKRFWHASDIHIVGNPQLQKGIRFNLFHLNQGAGRDGKTNFPAKALTGRGYEGHYFWDTEMYLLPFFTYTQPDVAKQLLMYRVSILKHAKKRAKELGQEGALFAWRTINGEETSAYYPAGTAQIHINADIVYAFYLYEKITGDSTFVSEHALDLIFETAKFWLSFGHFRVIDGHERFCIDGVTGPDEYSALVNNNFYTNKMAQHHLRYAVQLAKRHQCEEEERVKWEKAAESMYFGYDSELGVTKQDDHFLTQAIWPFESTPKEHYPLLLHYHPMMIYKHQVCKQADTVLAQMLFYDDFALEQLQRDFAYYEQVTTHDSSLSRSIFSVMASRIGESQKAYQYFMDTALMDFIDLQGNAEDGVHAANMGGSWLSLIYGFAGLRYRDGLVIENHLPAEIEKMTFTLTYKCHIISITLTQQEISIQSPTREQLTITKRETGGYIIQAS